ncbi:unnamed protein product [Hymenolepis diminuta]|uniref:Uncharacterized protein n=1 Tax=Hymenolepis diminuta TaxID=6216 RepID=A0A564Y385_HYMDI|nr:unnamed protein product [Hymenolepis diminuta]
MLTSMVGQAAHLRSSDGWSLTSHTHFHAKRLELAQPDYAWKLTLAATILAGFGFVAFRMVRPHF